MTGREIYRAISCLAAAGTAVRRPITPGHLAILLLGSATVCAISSCGEAPSKKTPAPAIQGQVVHADRPVAKARLRIKGTHWSVLSDAAGRFEFPVDAPSGPIRVTAWKSGYLIGGAAAGGPHAPITIELSPLPASDNANYHWVDPRPNPDGEFNCANCHQQIYDEWLASGHARSAGGSRFLDLYRGTDSQGRRRGWSLRHEHPDGAGVCTSCHAPGITAADAAHDDLTLARGASALGVHCDYCHKIQDATKPNDPLTHGRFAHQLLRPSQGQLFFGPLDDVDRGEDAYSPLYSQSRYCASCHEGIVFGVHVYSTYSEWLKSPAAGRGRQCQGCHMRPSGKMTHIAPEAGGIQRDPATLATHRFAGGTGVMLRECLSVSVKTQPRGERLSVQLSVTAKGVGHRVPTGFIDRNLVLLVQAKDAEGNTERRIDGPVLPPIAGRSFAGLAGKLYAKQLLDAAGTGPRPFWRPGREPIDTRLLPERPDRLTFTFPRQIAQLQVRLVYRRFWPQTSRDKGWKDDAITIVEGTIVIPDTGRAAWSSGKATPRK